VRRSAWFDDDRALRPNLKTLTEIRHKIDGVRQEMLAAKRTEGQEGVEWQLTTIDWLLAYDAAAVKLRPEGEFGRLVTELERASPRATSTLSGPARPTTRCWPVACARRCRRTRAK
jgi:hypothetical protein